MFSSFGADGDARRVSRQQVLPAKDPEVAAVLEDDFLQPRRQAAEGRARDRHRPRPTTDDVVVRCDDGRVVRVEPRRAGHRLGAQHGRPRPRARPASSVDAGGYVPINHHCVTNVPPHLRRRRRQRQAAAVVGGGDAGPQGGRARDGPAQPSSTATSTTTRRPRPSSPSPRSPTSAWPRPRRSRRPQDPRHQGAVLGHRRRRSINNDTRGFVKIVSDPATGVVLGGSIVGRHAAELISRDRARRHRRPARSATSSRACSSTPPSPRRWPKPPK